MQTVRTLSRPAFSPPASASVLGNDVILSKLSDIVWPHLVE